MNPKKNKELSKRLSLGSRSKNAASSEFLSVPSFLLKTYEIVSDESLDDIVRWNETGDAFIILKTHEFCEEILPAYFKHKNLSSFVRQLNMYGFHKTKQKNNEHCFVHKNFRRDNKGLLLDMKRKSKDTPSEKRSEREVESPPPDSELQKQVRALQTKVKEQDKKIDQLIESNKEFKNSILALYMELESQKKEKKEVPDFMKMFKNAADNYSIQRTKESVNNLYYVDGNNFPGMNRNPLSGGSHKIVHMDMPSYYKNNMFDNGKLSAKNMKAIKEEMKEMPMRRRESKELRSPSPNYPDAWKRVGGLNSRPGTPTSGLKKEFTTDNISEYSHNPYENLHSGLQDKNPIIVSQANSVISDFDHIKDKFVDNVSLCSNPGYSAFQMNNIPAIDRQMIMQYNLGLANHGKFELMSQQSAADMSDLRSVSDFSADNGRFCTIKRIHP